MFLRKDVKMCWIYHHSFVNAQQSFDGSNHSKCSWNNIIRKKNAYVKLYQRYVRSIELDSFEKIAELQM